MRSQDETHYLNDGCLPPHTLPTMGTEPPVGIDPRGLGFSEPRRRTSQASEQPPAGGGGVTPSGAIGYGLGQVRPETALELDRQILAWRQLRRLHHPMKLWLPDAEADFSFEEYEDAVEFAVGDLDDDSEEYRLAREAAIAEITSFTVCAHCRNIESEQAQVRGYEYAAWPCQTATVGGWAADDKIDQPEEKP